MTSIIGQHHPKVMRRIASAALAAIFLLSSLPTHSASNVTTTSGINAPAQTVVAEQLSAFKLRNSQQAYAVMSDRFREKYKTPLKFTTMVRVNFWELYNHINYKFIGQSHIDGAEIQKVQVTGDDGLSYVYLFRLSPSSAGVWMIDDMIMLDAKGQQI